MEQERFSEMLSPALYLLPTGLSDSALTSVLPERNIRIMSGIRHFVVENVREARRFIRRALPDADISSMTFFELNRHTDLTQVSEYLGPLRCGEPMGLMSDAGCPGVADPGSVVVGIAQREGLKVVPLVGPSSVLLGLMASGFNGQGFCFHGYLPIEEKERADMLRRLEASSRREDMTHIFIETPYRNAAMMQSLAASLSADTLVCMASNLTDEMTERVITRTVAEWRGLLPGMKFEKIPAVFLIYAGRSGVADTRSGRKNAYRNSSSSKSKRR